MVRVLFFLALVIAAASAFVSPAQRSVSAPAFARKTVPNMIPVEATTELVSAVTQNAQLMIASNADEFGGFFYPVAGLGLLATLILYLSPPLSDN